MIDYLTNDGRYHAARKTDQSNGRGWDFAPAKPVGGFDARTVRGGFILRTVAQAVVCAVPVILMWVIL